MAGADATASEMNPRLCPKCGGTIQGKAKRVKCSHCGERITPVDVPLEIRPYVEAGHALLGEFNRLAQSVKDFVAAVHLTKLP